MGDGERYQILRPLGPDGATFAGRDTDPSAGGRLVVLERVTGAAPKPDERAEAVRRVRSLMALSNPRIVHVRDVVERETEVLAVSDFSDGEWLSALSAQAPRAPLDISLRMVLDALDGLAALHDLRDERGQPRPLVHGGLAPTAVVVGLDGVAQVARAARSQRIKTEERFVAPELRQRVGTPDVRSDIYSVGTILRDLLASPPPEERWAEALTEIAWRACSFDREARWPSAATMAAALRRALGAKLATPARTAAFARDRFSERVRGRRVALESPDRDSAAPESIRPSDMEVLAEVSELQSDPKTMRPPTLSRPALGKVQLAKAADRWGVASDDEVARRPTTQRGLAPPGPPPAPPVQPQPPPPPALQHAIVVPRPGQQQASPPPPPAHVTAPVPVPPPPPPVVASPPAPAQVPVPVPESDLAEPSRGDRTTPVGPPPVLVEPPALIQPDLVEFSMTPSPAVASEVYGRSIPTAPLPQRGRGRFILQASVVALGMVLTFVIGWWTGRTGPNAKEGSAMAPATSAGAGTPVVPSALASSPHASAAAATNLQAPLDLPSAEPPPARSASSSPLPVAPPQPTTAVVAPAVQAEATPPSSPEPRLPSAAATAIATTTPTATHAPRAQPLAAPAAPAPKATMPATSGAYNPSEL